VSLLFYKTITLWFPCLDGLIQTLGNVSRVKKSAQNHSPSPRVSRAFLTLATFPRVWIRPSKQGNHKVIVYSNHPPSITRQLPTAISTNASHFSHRTNKHLRNLRLFTRTPLGIYLASNFDHKFTYTQEASQRTRRNRPRNIIWFNPPFSRTKYAKHTIVNKGVKIWNSLDKGISSIMFYCTFKKVKNIFLVKYT
jgi:hypothetical protein